METLGSIARADLVCCDEVTTSVRFPIRRTHPPFLIHAVVIDAYKFFWISAWLVNVGPEILVREWLFK